VGIKFWEVVCDEQGIGGGGEHCGGNETQLGRINVLYHEASGSKYVPHAVLIDLNPGVMGAVTLSRRSASTSVRGNLVNQNAGAVNKWAEAHYTKNGNKL
jgi:tubulin beta